MTECLFCKMVAGIIKPDKVYETESILAFRDIHPQAPTHILVIPKQHLATLNELDDVQLGGELLLAVRTIAEKEGIAQPGYRTIINCNTEGGQVIYHLHVHLLGGHPMKASLG